MATTIAPPTPTPIARPPRSRLLRSDVAIVVVGVPLTAVILWLVDGGVATVTGSFDGALTGVGQLAGIACGLAALGGLALAARPRSVERRFGLDRMLGWHRWTGMVAAFALAVHAVCLIWAYALRANTNPITEIGFLFSEPWMPAAMVAGALMALVSVTSWRRVRNLMAYETWYYLHLLGYVAVAFALGHVLVIGSDFVSNDFARYWWIGLYVAVAVLIVFSRLGPLLVSLSRPLRVTGIQPLPGGGASVWVGGPALRRLNAQAGQYFQVRFGVGPLRWQTHPYSLSAAPYAQGLRFSFTAGDDAAAFSRIKPGTRVWLEGPYGVFTADRAAGMPVLLVAGGTGIAPLRSILEDLAPHQRPIVLLRISRHTDAWFVDELEHLLARKNGRLELIAGSRISLRGRDPLSAASLLTRVPDLDSRAAFICGPSGMSRAAAKGLAGAGMAKKNIHSERYDY